MTAAILGILGGYLTVDGGVKTYDRGHRHSPEMESLINKTQHGDVLLVKSNEFSSRLFSTTDKCGISSFKLVYKKNGKEFFIASDFEQTSDLQGGLIALNKKELLSNYSKGTKFAIARPLNINNQHLKKIDEIYNRLNTLKNKKENRYDFSFNHEDFNTWNCTKIIYFVYKDSFFNLKKIQKRKLIKSIYPCDINSKKTNIISKWVDII